MSCNDEASGSSLTAVTTASEVTTTLMDLRPYLTYTCTVTASNSAGSGPVATLNFTTLADGKKK